MPRVTVTLVGNEAPSTFNNLGWITDGANSTDGNNVEAGIDRNGTNGVDVTVAGTSRTFSFIYSPQTDEPLTAAYQNGEVTDMFYWTKLAAQGDVGCVAEPISHYVSYRDQSDSSAGGTPILTWAADTQRWVRDILGTIAKAGGGKVPQEVEQHAKVFLMRSTANQFVWLALRGASRWSLLKNVIPALPYLRGPDPTPWMRVVAGIIAPRRLLRSRMIAEARRKARKAAE